MGKLESLSIPTLSDAIGIVVICIAVFLLLKFTRVGCKIFGYKQEKYADQVVHGTVGGIAGPIMDPSLFETSEKPVKFGVPYVKAWPRPMDA